MLRKDENKTSWIHSTKSSITNMKQSLKDIQAELGQIGTALDELSESRRNIRLNKIDPLRRYRRDVDVLGRSETLLGNPRRAASLNQTSLRNGGGVDKRVFFEKQTSESSKSEKRKHGRTYYSSNVVLDDQEESLDFRRVQSSPFVWSDLMRKRLDDSDSATEGYARYPSMSHPNIGNNSRYDAGEIEKLTYDAEGGNEPTLPIKDNPRTGHHYEEQASNNDIRASIVKYSSSPSIKSRNEDIATNELGRHRASLAELKSRSSSDGSSESYDQELTVSYKKKYQSSPALRKRNVSFSKTTDAMEIDARIPRPENIFRGHKHHSSKRMQEDIIVRAQDRNSSEKRDVSCEETNSERTEGEIYHNVTYRQMSAPPSLMEEEVLTTGYKQFTSSPSLKEQSCVLILNDKADEENLKEFIKPRNVNLSEDQSKESDNEPIQVKRFQRPRSAGRDSERNVSFTERQEHNPKPFQEAINKPPQVSARITHRQNKTAFSDYKSRGSPNSVLHEKHRRASLPKLEQCRLELTSFDEKPYVMCKVKSLDSIFSKEAGEVEEKIVLQSEDTSVEPTHLDSEKTKGQPGTDFNNDAIILAIELGVLRDKENSLEVDTKSASQFELAGPTHDYNVLQEPHAAEELLDIQQKEKLLGEEIQRLMGEKTSKVQRLSKINTFMPFPSVVDVNTQYAATHSRSKKFLRSLVWTSRFILDEDKSLASVQTNLMPKNGVAIDEPLVSANSKSIATISVPSMQTALNEHGDSLGKALADADSTYISKRHIRKRTESAPYDSEKRFVSESPTATNFSRNSCVSPRPKSARLPLRVPLVNPEYKLTEQYPSREAMSPALIKTLNFRENARPASGAKDRQTSFLNVIQLDQCSGIEAKFIINAANNRPGSSRIWSRASTAKKKTYEPEAMVNETAFNPFDSKIPTIGIGVPASENQRSSSDSQMRTLMATSNGWCTSSGDLDTYGYEQPEPDLVNELPERDWEANLPAEAKACLPRESLVFHNSCPRATFEESESGTTELDLSINATKLHYSLWRPESRSRTHYYKLEVSLPTVSKSKKKEKVKRKKKRSKKNKKKPTRDDNIPHPVDKSEINIYIEPVIVEESDTDSNISTDGSLDLNFDIDPIKKPNSNEILLATDNNSEVMQLPPPWVYVAIKVSTCICKLLSLLQRRIRSFLQRLTFLKLRDTVRYAQRCLNFLRQH
ncbi:hypothetical protein HDU67_004217 [Dinochytrium kinnereticum]|nr:hypothetical protein HDU67_004217 [Dinochytrium kinnereticum]